eukprot:scaffold35186_cov168-Skeletonema_marinoi.AAC.1
MAKTILTASTMLLICTYSITTSGANSNMVSITHRSTLNGMSPSARPPYAQFLVDLKTINQLMTQQSTHVHRRLKPVAF